MYIPQITGKLTSGFPKSKAIINFIEFIEISLYLKATTYINDENVWCQHDQLHLFLK